MNNAAAAGISFQLKLYEYDSKLEFIYRQEAGALLNPSASIGITNAATGAGNFLSLINTGTNPADTNSQVEANGLNTKPASGQVYGFVPNYIPPIAPSAINFTNIGATTFSVDWTDNTNTETYYEVYMSSDSINFNKVSTIYSTSISNTGSIYHYVPSGLNPSSYYYFKIYANNEGSLPNNFAYGFTSTSAGLLSGIKTICPWGCDYTSIGNANADIRYKGVYGSLILEFDSSYRANVETYPIDFGNLNTSASNTVTGNYIGGSAVQCGGAPLTKTADDNNAFIGISLAVGLTPISTVSNNIIQNINWSNYSLVDFTPLSMGGGINCTGNTIGAATGTGSITVTDGAAGGYVIGIRLNSGSGAFLVDNNTIGSITTNNFVNYLVD